MQSIPSLGLGREASCSGAATAAAAAAAAPASTAAASRRLPALAAMWALEIAATAIKQTPQAPHSQGDRWLRTKATQPSQLPCRHAPVLRLEQAACCPL